MKWRMEIRKTEIRMKERGTSDKRRKFNKKMGTHRKVKE